MHVTPYGGMQGVRRWTQRQHVPRGPTRLTKTQVCGKQMCMAGHGIPCLASACALFWISPGLFVPNASCVRAVAIHMAWRTISAMMRSCHHLYVNFKSPITVKGHRNSLSSLIVYRGSTRWHKWRQQLPEQRPSEATPRCVVANAHRMDCSA